MLVLEIREGRSVAGAYLWRVVPLGGGKTLCTCDEVAFNRRIGPKDLHTAVRGEASRVKAARG